MATINVSPGATALQAAVDKAKSGDVINVGSGTYAKGADCRTAKHGLQIIGTPDVIVLGSNGKTADAFNFEGCNGTIFRSINVKATGVGRAGWRIANSTGTQIIGCVADRCGTWGIYSSHTTDFLVDGCITSNAKAEHGIYISNSAVRPIVRGNISFGNERNGIHLNGDASQGGSGIVTGAVIEKNIFYGNTQNGINADGMQNSIIRNNLIYDNARHGVALYRIDAAKPSTGNLIEWNTLVAGSGFAIQLTENATGNRVLYNVLVGGIGGSTNPSEKTGNIEGTIALFVAYKSNLHLKAGDSSGYYAGVVPPPPPPPPPPTETSAKTFDFPGRVTSAIVGGNSVTVTWEGPPL